MYILYQKHIFAWPSMSASGRKNRCQGHSTKVHYERKADWEIYWCVSYRKQYHQMRGPSSIVSLKERILRYCISKRWWENNILSMLFEMRRFYEYFKKSWWCKKIARQHQWLHVNDVNQWQTKQALWSTADGRMDFLPSISDLRVRVFYVNS
jgi:hypothetical protein